MPILGSMHQESIFLFLDSFGIDPIFQRIVSTIVNFYKSLILKGRVHEAIVR